MLSPEHRKSFILLLFPDDESNWLICADWMVENGYSENKVEATKASRVSQSSWTPLQNAINDIWWLLTNAEQYWMYLNPYKWPDAAVWRKNHYNLSDKDIQEAKWLDEFVQMLPDKKE